jgi:ribonuclease HII
MYNMTTLEMVYDLNNDYELCLDEVGRGCLFGDVYIACVVLPKDTDFDKTNIKDSKKFTSKKKLKTVANYIKEHALCWHIESISSEKIDEINILQSVMLGMHNCIDEILKKIDNEKKIEIIVDGNYFNKYKNMHHVCVEKGDGKYVGIAAASILAKDGRDEYISNLCKKYECLNEYYNLEKNVGYATKDHLNGIKENGITQWHRRTFGICKNYDKIKNIL